MDEIAELRLKLKQKEEREIKKEPIKKEAVKKEPIKSEPVKITGGLPPGFSGHKPVETQTQKNKRLYKQMKGLGR